MTTTYATLLASCALAIFGQLSIKWGAGAGSLAKIVWSPWLWSGLVAYAISMMLWVWALTQVRLGVAYAFTCVTFVGVYIASFVILKEPFNWIKVAALALIVCGFLMLAKWG